MRKQAGKTVATYILKSSSNLFGSDDNLLEALL